MRAVAKFIDTHMAFGITVKFTRENKIIIGIYRPHATFGILGFSFKCV